MFKSAQFFSRSNDFHPRSKRSSRRRRLASFGQGLEHLEDRRLLAATPELLTPSGIAVDASTYVTNMKAIDGTLIFIVDDGAQGLVLWKSDGTPQGTVPFKAGIFGVLADPLALALNHKVFFAASDDTYGNELWVTDGTESGTMLVKDINPFNGPFLGNGPYHLGNVNGTLFFAADEGNADNNADFELWKSDGTEEGTVRVKGFAGTDSLSPNELTDFGGTLFFQSCCTEDHTGLWKSDGTEAGTTRLSTQNPRELTVVGDTLFFSGAPLHSNSRKLWKTDGTEAGTVVVKDGFIQNDSGFAQ